MNFMLQVYSMRIIVIYVYFYSNYMDYLLMVNFSLFDGYRHYKEVGVYIHFVVYYDIRIYSFCVLNIQIVYINNMN